MHFNNWYFAVTGLSEEMNKGRIFVFNLKGLQQVYKEYKILLPQKKPFKISIICCNIFLFKLSRYTKFNVNCFTIWINHETFTQY